MIDAEIYWMERALIAEKALYSAEEKLNEWLKNQNTIEKYFDWCMQ